MMEVENQPLDTVHPSEEKVNKSKKKKRSSKKEGKSSGSIKRSKKEKKKSESKISGSRTVHTMTSLYIDPLEDEHARPDVETSEKMEVDETEQVEEEVEKSTHEEEGSDKVNEESNPKDSEHSPKESENVDPEKAVDQVLEDLNNQATGSNVEPNVGTLVPEEEQVQDTVPDSPENTTASGDKQLTADEGSKGDTQSEKSEEPEEREEGEKNSEDKDMETSPDLVVV